MRGKLFEHQARLDVAVVLILAGVLFNRTADLVIENLADWYARINAHGVDREHFQRPVAAEADVAEAGRYVDEQAQSADGEFRLRGRELLRGDVRNRRGPRLLQQRV